MDLKSLLPNNLHYLSYNGKIDQIAKLAFIEKSMNEQDDDGRTPLLLACAQNHTAVAKYLINLGANINCQDKNLSTPLHWAVYNSNVELVNILIEREANVQAKDINGIQAIHLAALKGNNEIVRILISTKKAEEVTDRLGITPLHLASYCGHNDIIKMLLVTGRFDINATDNAAINPLLLAVASCHNHTVKLLLQKSADSTTSSDDCNSYPIHWAAVSGDLEMVSMLNLFIDRWLFDFKYLDQFKCTPIFLATAYGHDEAVTFLLKKNHSIDLRSGQREIYLILTNLEGPDGVINKYYNEIGTLPNTLHWAAAFCSNNVVEKLLNNGANIEELGTFHNTPLHTAASFGNKAVVELLIDRGADMNALDKYKSTPLHWAIAHCHVETIQHLIDKGANKNNALCWAAACGNLNMVQLLIDCRCDINEVDEDPEYPRTPLMWAATCGYAEIIKFLLDNGADISNNNNRDLIHWCTVHGLIDSIKILIERGVDVNESDLCFDATALQWAVSTGNIEIAKFLLSVDGIEINAKDNEGDSPILYAVNGIHYEMTKMLIEHGADVNIRGALGRPLCIAANDGYLKIVELLVESGADINRPEYGDNTPINLAISNGHIDVVNYLIEKGAEKIDFIHLIAEYGTISDLMKYMKPEDVNALNDKHQTPIFNTVHGKLDNLQYLLEKGANVNHKDSLNRTPLYLAVQYNNINSVRFLIESGADVNAKCDPEGMTPLMEAIEYNNLEIFNLLIKNNASIEITDDFQFSVLHCVARRSNHIRFEMIQYLISKKVNINVIDHQGITPLHLAVMAVADNNNLGIVEVLLAYGAEVNVIASIHNTPIVKAVQIKNYELVKLLLLYGADVNLDSKIIKYCIDAKDIMILELLRCAGLRLSNVELPSSNNPNIPIDPEIVRFIAQWDSNPLPLKHLCRIAIRRACGKQYLKIKRIEKLPNVLKHYLVFNF